MRSNNIIKKIRNRKIIITAGGTIEPIDPVRYIGNHSSGKMGIALVKAFLKYSDKVILIHGRLTVPIPKNIVSIPAHTVQEMTAVLESQLSSDAVVIMAAAISDFKVKRISKHKIKTKRSFSIELVPTIDILKRLSSKKSKKNFFIGFAVETQDIVENAGKKLKDKKLDLIIANPVSSEFNPFGSDDNKVYFIDEKGTRELPVMKKEKIAFEILKYIAGHL